jgi:hypothetical protein
MPIAPIAKLSKQEQRELLDDLNYLNLGEIKSFCKAHAIPYTIAIQTESGQVKNTGENDRKGVILKRVRHFLRTGSVLPQTCFVPGVVCFDPLPQKLSPHDRLLYGQYDKKNRAMNAVLKSLTEGQFRNGAIARILAREFWSRGEAPTFAEFASVWQKATAEHTQPNAEWAYLSDLSRKDAGKNWKKLRAQKAAKVMRTLRRITDS